MEMLRLVGRDYVAMAPPAPRRDLPRETCEASAGSRPCVFFFFFVFFFFLFFFFFFFFFFFTCFASCLCASPMITPLKAPIEDLQMWIGTQVPL